MNWTMFAVITVVAVLVPLALVGVFSATQDTHLYQRHYDKCGFSQEILPANRSKAETSDSPSESLRFGQSKVEPPVVRGPWSEWPPEL